MTVGIPSVFAHSVDPKYRPNVTNRVDKVLRTLTVEQIFAVVGTDKLFPGTFD
jgi:hypothetical protein